MVTSRRMMIGLSAVALVTCGAARQTEAQRPSVLKQLQTEVSSVVAEGRRAVVTVEESPMTTVVLALQYKSVDGLEKPLNRALQGRGQVLAESRTNSLIYTGEAGVLPAVKDYVGKVDRLNPAPSELKLDVFFTKRTDGAAQATPTPSRSGSGFSIGGGYVLTSADVVEGMKNPTVVTDAGVRLQARVAGWDKELNVGLLQVTSQGAEAKAAMGALKLGDSSSVRPGQFGISIGNQSGEDNSCALMLVGGLRTEGTYAGAHFYPSLIQIAGTVGAGSSGAPLLNADGEVVGIMVGVPADSVAYVQELYESKPAATGTGVPVLQDIPIIGNLFRTSKPSGGKTKPDRQPGPPPSRDAGDARVKPGQTRNTPGQAQKQTKAAPDFVAKPMGTPESVTFTAAPPIADATLTLTPTTDVRYTNGHPVRQSPQDVWTFVRPPVTSAGFAIPIDLLKPTIEALRAGRPLVRTWMGADLQDERIPVEENGIVRTLSSVKVGGIYRDSPAQRAGLLPGDTITAMNGTPVRTGADVRAVLMTLQPGVKVPVEATREGKPVRVTIELEKRPEQVKVELITGRPTGTSR